MPTIVSFYQRFPNEVPPLNLSAFDRTGYTYAENFRRTFRNAYFRAESGKTIDSPINVVRRADVFYYRSAAAQRRRNQKPVRI